MSIERVVYFIINKIMKIEIKFDQVYAMLKLYKNPPEIVETEIQNFQADIKKYGSSAFLWLNDDYPNMVLLYQLLGIDVISLLNVRSNMKKVVNECYNFMNDVEVNNNTLFAEEMEESKEFFLKELQPTEFLKKDPYINYMKGIFTEQLTLLEPQIKEYSEKIIPKIKEFYKNFDLSSIKSLKGLRNNQELINLIENIKKIQKESMPDLGEISKELLKKSEELREVYNENIAIAYQKLREIKDIDSFNIEFTKFLARLFYIRDEKEKNKPYLQINPNWYDSKTRKKLKRFLNQKLKKKYSMLSKYLLSMFKYNKY